MSYSEFLGETIKNSGKSLRQIAMECKNQYNVKITASYLSKLQTGGQTPASDKVNIAVAKVCKINPDDLLFEAYFERSPEIVKETINTMIIFIKSMFLSVLDIDNIKNLGVKDEINKYLNMSTRQFVQEMTKCDVNDENPLQFDFNIDNPKSISEEEILNDMFMKFSIGFKMLDNSMFPIIQEGAKIELDTTKELKNGDIVVVVFEDNKYLIRTYVKNGNTITLIPANKSFETLTYNSNEINIKGIVKSITIEL